MQIDDVPFGTGHAIVKAVQLGDICLRHIEFTAGCSADDWCYEGHIGFVLSGAFSIAIRMAAGWRFLPAIAFISVISRISIGQNPSGVRLCSLLIRQPD